MDPILKYYILGVIILGIILVILGGVWEFLTKEGRRVLKAEEDLYHKGKERDKTILPDTFKEEKEIWKKRSGFFKILLLLYVIYLVEGFSIFLLLWLY